MNKIKKIIIAVICILILLHVAIGLIAYNRYVSVRKADWQMHGAWVVTQGQSEGTVEFGLKAKVKDYSSEIRSDDLELEFSFPEDFRYDLEYEEHFSITGINGLDYYGCIVSVNDAENNGYACDCLVVFDIQKQYLLIDFRQELGPTLVASADPDVDPQEILKHFEGYEKCWDTFKD